MMYETAQKEQFSIAFVHAVASVAGFKLKDCKVDDDSIDLDIAANRSFGTTIRAPHLGVQAKCTATDDGQGDELSFVLEMKNYEDLRDELVHHPRILVVLCVPAQLGDWLHEAADQTAMRRVAYWTSLRGFPAVPGQATKTVRLRRADRFTVASLTAMMTRISEGGYP